MKDIAQEIVEHNGSVRPNIEDVTAKVAQVQEILDTEKREQFAEMDDRLRRRTNLLIFRLPEEKNTDEAKAEDVSKVGQILKELNVNATAQDIRRLGQYRKESERPRPVRVSFTSEKERDEVLSSAYKLNRNRKDKDE